MSSPIDFEGVFPAMCTPFDEDERIDFETLQTDAQRLEPPASTASFPSARPANRPR